MSFDPNRRVDPMQDFSGSDSLRAVNIFLGIQDLALQVVQFNDISVDQDDLSDTCTYKSICNRTSKGPET